MTTRRACSLALWLVAIAARAAAGPQTPAPAPAQVPTQTPAQPSGQGAAHTPEPPPIDPRAVAFQVSVDHDAEDPVGPKVLKYVIEFVPVAGSTGVKRTFDLGKPEPRDGTIAVSLTKVLLPGTYLAHVRTVGRGGSESAQATVGPFVITEKTGQTQEEYEKELRDLKRQKEQKPSKPKAGRGEAAPITTKW